MGRTPEGDRPLTPAERAKRYRERKKAARPPADPAAEFRTKIESVIETYTHLLGPDRLYQAMIGDETCLSYWNRLPLVVWRYTTAGQEARHHQAGQVIAQLARITRPTLH